MPDNARELRNAMQACAKAVERELPKGAGFAILAFPFGGKPDEKAQYVSNATRADVIRMMENFLERNPMSEPEKN